MILRVQLFAAAKDAAGASTIEVTLANDATIADLRAELIESSQGLKAMKDTLLIAVNNQYAANQQALHAEDEVACFPPVSGG